MRRSRTEPDQGPHVRPGRRPIRRAASTAASSNRLRRRRYAGQRGVELRSPASTRRRRERGVEVGEHVAQLAAPISEPLSHGVDVGGGQVEVQNLDGLVVVGSGELGHERRAIGKSERPHAPRRPERDSHAVVVPRGLELAERQHTAEHLGLSGAPAPGRPPRRAPPTRPGLRTRRRRPGRWRGSRKGSGARNASRRRWPGHDRRDPVRPRRGGLEGRGRRQDRRFLAAPPHDLDPHRQPVAP